MEIKKTLVEYPDMFWAVYKQCTDKHVKRWGKIVPMALLLDQPYDYSIHIVVTPPATSEFIVHIKSEYAQYTQLLSISLSANLNSIPEILDSFGWQNFTDIVLEFAMDSGCDLHPPEGNKLFTLGFDTREQFDEVMDSLLDYAMEPDSWEWADEDN